MTEMTWTGTITDAMREQHGANLPAIIATAAKTALRHQGELSGEPRLVSHGTLDQVMHARGDVTVKYVGDVS